MWGLSWGLWLYSFRDCLTHQFLVVKWAGQSYAPFGKRFRRYKDYDLLELIFFLSSYKRGRKRKNPWISRETLEASLPIYLTDRGKRATI